MTTEHIQSEHNDTENVNNNNETVVEQQHTPETSESNTGLSAEGMPEQVTSDASSTPDEAQKASSSVQFSDTDTSVSESANESVLATASDFPSVTEETSGAGTAQVTTAGNTQQETTPQEGEAAVQGIEEQSQGVATSSEQAASDEVDAVAAPVFEEESAEVIAEVAPMTEVKEEYHPFTSFIEEYRQAQAQAEADLNATLQESQAFAEFAQPEGDTPIVDEPVSVQDILPPVDFGEGSAFVLNSDSATTVNVADVTTQSPAEAVTNEENQRIAAATEANKEDASTTTTPPSERPVSPLLRPAQRRFQRHGTTRHREETVAPPTTETTEATTTSPNDTSSEPATETAKPQRRYRFDRRPAAQAASVTPPTQTPTPASNNGTTLTPPPAAQPTPTFARTEEAQTTKPEPVSSSAAPAKSVAAIPEPLIVEKASTEVSTPTAPVEHGRRKQNNHREKEQIVTPPVTAPESVLDIAATLVEESKATPEDVAPEDMPPLEYAELQKANSRRRRRHRTNGNGTPTAKEDVASNGAQADVQAAPTLAPPATPATPATPTNSNATPPASSANPYTIVSGYTVGQMNQGNEASGPFMGPEPSPARGSVNTTRDGRTVRVESQPLRTPYQAPGSASGTQGISPASMNHFANVVSQAIQTQADRMVAELRRGNQAPTNVSVSLPPFPSTERVGVFVDVANLLYSARTQRIAIDFGKLLDFLRGNRRLVRAHAYCPTSPQPGDEQMFLTAVKGLGYRITTKNYKTFASGAKKADLDLDLCMDVVRLVDGAAVDCIVLVSGDSDFMPMLDYCSDHGVRVEVAAFDEAMSQTLRQSCDLFVNLSMLEEIRA